MRRQPAAPSARACNLFGLLVALGDPRVAEQQTGGRFGNGFGGHGNSSRIAFNILLQKCVEWQAVYERALSPPTGAQRSVKGI